jgi:hypothetical protein
MKEKHCILFCALAFVFGYFRKCNDNLVIAFLLAMFFSSLAFSQPLAGTDELGRTLPQNNLVGELDRGKTVAMFCFLWMGHPGSATSTNYCDLSKISYPDTVAYPKTS